MKILKAIFIALLLPASACFAMQLNLVNSLKNGDKNQSELMVKELIDSNVLTESQQSRAYTFFLCMKHCGLDRNIRHHMIPFFTFVMHQENDESPRQSYAYCKVMNTLAQTQKQIKSELRQIPSYGADVRVAFERLMHEADNCTKMQKHIVKTFWPELEEKCIIL